MTSCSHKAITAICNGPLNSLVAAEGMSLKVRNETYGKIYTVLHPRSKSPTHTIKVERQVDKVTGNPNTWKNAIKFTVSYANSESNKVPENINDIIKGILERCQVNPAFDYSTEEDNVVFELFMNETEDMLDLLDPPRVVFDPIAMDRVIYHVLWVLLAFQAEPNGYNPVRQLADQKKRKAGQISNGGAGGGYDTEPEDDAGYEEMVVEAQAQAITSTDVPGNIPIVQAQPITTVSDDTPIVQAQPITSVPDDTPVVQAQPITTVPDDTPIVQAQPQLNGLAAILARIKAKQVDDEPAPAESAPAGVAKAVQAMAAPAEVMIKPEPVHDTKAEIFRLLNEDIIDRAAIIELINSLEVKKSPPNTQNAETFYEEKPVGREVLLVKKMETKELMSILKNATMELEARKVNIPKKDSSGQSPVDLTKED